MKDTTKNKFSKYLVSDKTKGQNSFTFFQLFYFLEIIVYYNCTLLSGCGKGIIPKLMSLQYLFGSARCLLHGFRKVWCTNFSNMELASKTFLF